jgi:alpha-tubulin suppressor-like RCC1 family protein
MVKTTSLSGAAINALTTGNSSILYNNQTRDLVLYSGSIGFTESSIFNLEINNINGECLILKHNSSQTNYVNLNVTSTGKLNLITNGTDKIVNIYHHNESTSGLSLAGTLITASATELNKLDGVTATTTELNYVDTTPGTAQASKALVVDENLDIVGIHNIETDNLTVNGILVTSSATELNYNDIANMGTAEGGKALVVDINRDISNIRNIELTNNITITNHNGTDKGLTLGNTLVTANASELNILDGITASTSELNVLDGITASTSELNILDGITASTSELNYVDTTPGTAEASKALIVDANRDISNIRNLQTENLTVNGTLVTSSATELNYNDTTPGTAEASKALVVDINRDISNIRNLTATNLTGAIQTTSQTLITDLGTLNNLSSNGNVNIAQHNGTTTGLQLNGTLVTATATELNILDGVTATTSEINILAGLTASTAEINVLDGITASTSELNILDGVTATYAEINVLDGITASTSELNILDGITSSTSELNILDGVTASTAEINTLAGVTASTSELNTLAGVTAGTAAASKALVLDSSRNIANINSLTTTSLTLGSTAITSTAAELNTLAGVTAGTAAASKALVLDASRNITNINSLTTTSLTLGSTAVTATATELNYLSGVTAGTAAANKALVLNASRNITNINSLTTTSLTLGSTAISATATEINTLAGVTAGTAAASKALVIDASRNITNINNFTTTNNNKYISSILNTGFDSISTIFYIQSFSIPYATGDPTYFAGSNLPAVSSTPSIPTLLTSSIYNGDLTNVIDIKYYPTTGAIFLFSNGTIKTFSSTNTYGQLGNGTTTGQNSLSDVFISGTSGSTLTKVTKITIGNGFIVVLLNTKTLRAWGLNNRKQLGDTTTTNRTNPVAVSGLADVKDIAAGNLSTIALLNDGTVKGWGHNNYGQLGSTGLNNYIDVTTISGVSNVSAIASGASFSLFLLTNGTVSACGINDYGQLGNSTNNNNSNPVTVQGLGGTIISIAAGYDHALALRNDGIVKSWGLNNFGQLGNNSTTNSNTSVTVSGITNAIAIAAGRFHSVVLLNDGTIRTFGLNSASSLGDGTITNRSIPTSINTTNISTYISPFIGRINSGINYWGIGPEISANSIRMGLCNSQGGWETTNDPYLKINCGGLDITTTNMTGNSTKFYHGTTGIHGDWVGFTLPGTFSQSYSIWSTNIGGESALIGIGSDTIIMSSPIDQGAINYYDEDNRTLAFSISGNGTITAGSDERLKDNINILQWNNILDKIKLLHPYTYTYKTPESVNRVTEKYEKIHKGFIAQNVYMAFPELVNIPDNYNYEEDDGKNYMSVEMNLFILPVIQCIQELVIKKDDLENKVNTLEQKNNYLETKVNEQNILINQILERLNNLEN